MTTPRARSIVGERREGRRNQVPPDGPLVARAASPGPAHSLADLLSRRTAVPKDSSPNRPVIRPLHIFRPTVEAHMQPRHPEPRGAHPQARATLRHPTFDRTCTAGAPRRNAARCGYPPISSPGAGTTSSASPERFANTRTSGALAPASGPSNGLASACTCNDRAKRPSRRPRQAHREERARPNRCASTPATAKNTVC